jgi:hypothetical protein
MQGQAERAGKRQKCRRFTKFLNARVRVFKNGLSYKNAAQLAHKTAIFNTKEASYAFAVKKSFKANRRFGITAE